MKIKIPIDINDNVVQVEMDLGQINCDVQNLELSTISMPPEGTFGMATRSITIESSRIGTLNILMKASDPDKLLFPGELTGGSVPPSRELYE